MRKLSLIFAFILVLAFGQVAFAQSTVTATLDAGGWTDGTDVFLTPGAVATVGITMYNDGPAGTMYDVGNGYQLGSPNGAGWVYFAARAEYGTNPFYGGAWTQWSGGTISHWNWDGSAWVRTPLDNTWPYGALSHSEDAGPNGGEPVGMYIAGATSVPPMKFLPGQTMTYGAEFQTLPGDIGKTLCFDMAANIGPDSWVWASVSGGINPIFNGGLGAVCWEIAEQPHEAPSFVNPPTNESFSHCGTATLDFVAKSNDDENSATPFTWTANFGTITSTGDTTASWSWNMMPQEGFETLEITVTDGLAASATTDVNITVTNDGPVITTCPDVAGGLTIQSGDTKTQTVVASDDCDALTWAVVSVTNEVVGDVFDVTDGVVTFTPTGDVDRLVDITVSVTDGLETVECTTHWHVIVGAPYGVQIEKEHDELQNHFSDVDVTLLGVDPLQGIGGFDLLIAYDQTALAFQAAFEGAIYAECGWEYFTFRQGPFGNCGNGCPSGMVRIIGVAEENDGPHHPTCDVNTLPVTLATMRFLVSDDRNLECQYVPIRFYWIDCGDNTISNISGTELYISAKVYDFDLDFNPNPIDNGTVGFPTFQGAQDFCLENPMPDKPTPIRNIDFINGGVDIICAEDIDARGDLNLNNLAYEIADAVMFTNYFIEGLSAFEYVEGAIAASDVNADGIPLTVSDLVYLLRVVVGDAIAYPKLNPMAATYSHESGVVAVDADMFAAHIVLSGDANVSLLADNMEMKTGMVDGNLNVIVYSMNANQTFAGSFLQTDAQIISVDFATYDGQPVVAKNVPKTFAVMQNYPNPFNPTTDIQFALPMASTYSISIYNVAGQLVETISGQADAGVVTATWDASDLASGVYFYKVAAGEFSKTMKAVLLK